MIAIITESIILLVLTAMAVYFGGRLLWLLLILVLADLVLLVFTLLRKIKSSGGKSRDVIPPLDQTFEMSGAEFEEYVADTYRHNGYKVLRTKKSCDQGIDIIVKRIFKTGIQAKCYSRPVGNRAVQEAAAGKKYYRLKNVAVVTNSIFTKSACQLAKKTKVRLVDRRVLARMVAKANGRDVKKGSK